MSTHEHHPKDTDALVKIRAGEVRMRSKTFFALRAVTSIVLTALILVLSSMISSFVLFSLNETGHAFLLGFGGRGIVAFLLLFPWPLFSVDLALIFLLDWLLRGFSFGYRFSVLSLFAGICGVSLLIALVINTTSLHHLLEMHADRGELPIAGGLYEDTRRPHHEFGVFRGIVGTISTSSFIMIHDDRDVDADDASYIVTLPNEIPPPLSPGDHVFVFGDGIGSSSVRAVNIQVFPKTQ